MNVGTVGGGRVRRHFMKGVSDDFDMVKAMTHSPPIKASYRE
jgi:hypothetical protein